MKWVITGTREGRNDVEWWLSKILKRVGKPELILIGGDDEQGGVDGQAYRWAATIAPIKVFYAEWMRLGDAAGPVRNKEMVNFASPRDLCIAFSFGIAKGTRGCMELARKRSLIVFECKMKKVFQ